jgi:hypothetical protein
VERQGRGWRGGGMDRDLQLALDPVLTDLVSAGVCAAVRHPRGLGPRLVSECGYGVVG